MVRLNLRLLNNIALPSRRPVPVICEILYLPDFAYF
jgi:hypothetical protein